MDKNAFKKRLEEMKRNANKANAAKLLSNQSGNKPKPLEGSKIITKNDSISTKIDSINKNLESGEKSKTFEENKITKNETMSNKVNISQLRKNFEPANKPNPLEIIKNEGISTNKENNVSENNHKYLKSEIISKNEVISTKVDISQLKKNFENGKNSKLSEENKILKNEEVQNKVKAPEFKKSLESEKNLKDKDASNITVQKNEILSNKVDSPKLKNKLESENNNSKIIEKSKIFQNNETIKIKENTSLSKNFGTEKKESNLESEKIKKNENISTKVDFSELIKKFESGKKSQPPEIPKKEDMSTKINNFQLTSNIDNQNNSKSTEKNIINQSENKPKYITEGNNNILKNEVKITNETPPELNKNLNSANNQKILEENKSIPKDEVISTKTNISQLAKNLENKNISIPLEGNKILEKKETIISTKNNASQLKNKLESENTSKTLEKNNIIIPKNETISTKGNVSQLIKNIENKNNSKPSEENKIITPKKEVISTKGNVSQLLKNLESKIQNKNNSVNNEISNNYRERSFTMQSTFLNKIDMFNKVKSNKENDKIKDNKERREIIPTKANISQLTKNLESKLNFGNNGMFNKLNNNKTEDNKEETNKDNRERSFTLQSFFNFNKKDKNNKDKEIKGNKEKEKTDKEKKDDKKKEKEKNDKEKDDKKKEKEKNDKEKESSFKKEEEDDTYDENYNQAMQNQRRLHTAVHIKSNQENTISNNNNEDNDDNNANDEEKEKNINKMIDEKLKTINKKYNEFFNKNFQTINNLKDNDNKFNLSRENSIIASFNCMQEVKIEDVYSYGENLKLCKDIYFTRLKNCPEKIFGTITEKRVRKWIEILSKNVSTLCDFNELNNIVKDTVSNLIIIKKDVKRTRVKENIFFTNFKDYLECLVIYFCKINNIKYKQGLNEIIGPFLFLTIKIPTLTLSEVFVMAQGFMIKFLTNYYHEKDFFSLKSTFSLINILLKYHFPSIYDLLNKYDIQPEIYSMSWILTCFAGKLDLDLLYELWNTIITLNDSLFSVYFIVSFLYYNREKYYSSDQSVILAGLNQLSITNKEDIREMIKIAIELRSKTPYSFRVLCNKLDIFTPNCDKLKEKYESIRPDLLFSMPIYPTEILFFAYHEDIPCPDELCQINKQKGKFYTCEFCDMKIAKYLNYIILDYRILEYGNLESLNESSGFLPNMIMHDQSDIKSNYFHEKLTDRFIEEKGKYHFAILTTKTDYFIEYENNFYRDQEELNDENNMNENVDMLLYQYQPKGEKELNVTMAKNASKKEKQKLKEYDNLKKTLARFNLRNIPYLSFVYGGFVSIHDKCNKKYQITLLNHDDEKCVLCQLEKAKEDEKLLNKMRKTYRNDLDDKALNMSYDDEDKIINNEIKEVDEKEEDKEEHISYDTRFDSSLSNIDDVDISKEQININEITRVISSSKFNIYFCKLILFDEQKINIEVMVMIKNLEICLYQFKILFLNDFVKYDDNKNINNENEGKSDEKNEGIQKFCTIPIKHIGYILMRKNEKNILDLTYAYEGNKNVFKNKILAMDFLDEQDAKKFIFSINHAKNAYKEFVEKNKTNPENEGKNKKRKETKLKNKTDNQDNNDKNEIDNNEHQENEDI